MLWKTIDTDDKAAANLVERLSLPKVLAELLVQRDITTTEAAEEFLRPRLAQLDNPFAMTHLEAAVERIEQAIEGESPSSFSAITMSMASPAPSNSSACCARSI